MNAGQEPLLDGINDVGSKGRGAWWAPRSLGRIMTMIALGSLAMAAYAQHTRAVPRRFPVPPRFTQPGSPAALRIVPPRDPAILVAPGGIDDAMVVTARPGIDDAMIVNPGGRRAASVQPAPAPGSPTSRLPLPSP